MKYVKPRIKEFRTALDVVGSDTLKSRCIVWDLFPLLQWTRGTSAAYEADE